MRSKTRRGAVSFAEADAARPPLAQLLQRQPGTKESRYVPFVLRTRRSFRDARA